MHRRVRQSTLRARIVRDPLTQSRDAFTAERGKDPCELPTPSRTLLSAQPHFRGSTPLWICVVLLIFATPCGVSLHSLLSYAYAMTEGPRARTRPCTCLTRPFLSTGSSGSHPTSTRRQDTRELYMHQPDHAGPTQRVHPDRGETPPSCAWSWLIIKYEQALLNTFISLFHIHFKKDQKIFINLSQAFLQDFK